MVLSQSQQKNSQEDQPTSDAQWAVACTSISFALTGLVVLLHLHPVTTYMISGTKVEGVISIILVGFNSAIVSIVSDASNNLAVRRTSNECNTTVLNGNLFYFSWGAFVTSILLLVAFLRSVFGMDVVGNVKNRAARLEVWSAFFACSLIVMGSSANIFQIDCLSQDGLEIYCRRCKFGISLGVISAFFSLCIVGLKIMTATSAFVIEGLLSLVLTILNLFGVVYLTSAQGPGSAIGNLYYFSWLAFLCAALLVANCYNEYMGSIEPRSDEDTTKEEGNGEIQVESLSSEDQF